MPLNRYVPGLVLGIIIVLFMSITFDGITREYQVFLPQDFQSDMPMVLNLHGYNVGIINQKNCTKRIVAETFGLKPVRILMNSKGLQVEGY